MINRILSQDTIAAPITPVGGSVCLIRISGNGALGVLKNIFKGARVFKTHRVYYGKIVNGNEVVDEVLVTVMLAPKSFTMEDVVEIGCHGGAKSAEAVLSLVLSFGVRLAEPGEFTKRAFLNGRIDLTQAEAAADLIAAKSTAARRGALNALSGGISNKTKEMANKILSLIARIEAAIDYPEHEDEINSDVSVIKLLKEITDEMKSLLSTYDKGKIIKDGVNIVITGKPNVGKSSLLNALLNDERAIITEIPGTTRDILKEQMMIGDIPINLVDTAGIRETDDVVEKIGIERAIRESENADLILLVVDEINNEGKTTFSCPSVKKLALINKVDILDKNTVQAIHHDLAASGFSDIEIMNVSTKNGTGIEGLRLKIKDMFISGEIDYETVLINSARHKQSLDKAFKHTINAMETAMAGFSEDFISIDLTAAYHFLCEITGESLSEDIIDKIFENFCLGK